MKEPGDENIFITGLYCRLYAEISSIERDNPIILIKMGNRRKMSRSFSVDR
ncbi:MAG: hypothetical protein IH612_08355 [Desulfofustis sp.]|nr:hypothetical protein [Desulfofustis sp.]